MLDKIVDSIRKQRNGPVPGTRMRAVWNGTVIAESDDTVVVEGNHYFPRDSIDPHALVASDTSTVCPWKGRASYLTVTANDAVNDDAAWYYPDPSPAAKQIQGRIAFWRGVQVTPAPVDEQDQ